VEAIWRSFFRHYAHNPPQKSFMAAPVGQETVLSYAAGLASALANDGPAHSGGESLRARACGKGIMRITGPAHLRPYRLR